MTSETKVPMPNFSFLGDDVSYGYDEHDLRDYGDARASERDAFWMAKVAAMELLLRDLGKHYEAEQRLYEMMNGEGDVALDAWLRRIDATLTNPRAGETA